MGFAQEVVVTDWSVVNTKVEDRDEWKEVVTVGPKAVSIGSVEGGFVAGLEWEGLL